MHAQEETLSDHELRTWRVSPPSVAHFMASWTARLINKLLTLHTIYMSKVISSFNCAQNVAFSGPLHWKGKHIHAMDLGTLLCSHIF